MKILCLIESLGSGGAERQLTGLAVMLRNVGHEVMVVTYYPQDFYRKSLDEAGVTYYYAKGAERKCKRIWIISKVLKRFAPDVCIAYLTTPSIIACILKILGQKGKLIVSERNTNQKNSLSDFFRFTLFGLAADYIVPNSYMQYNFIKEHYPNLIKNVKVITNFVDTDIFKPSKIKRERDNTILCVGRVFPQKNVLMFIEAIKELKKKRLDFKVKWYGLDEGEYAESCKRKVEEFGLDNEFVFCGATNNIKEQYLLADFLCLPSLYEGFPNVVCEAMSCGLPVVCSKVCDNPKLIEDSQNGFLFDPNNTYDMADKLNILLNLPDDEYRKMQERNRGKALELFSKEGFINKYLNLIN